MNACPLGTKDMVPRNQELFMHPSQKEAGRKRRGRREGGRRQKEERRGERQKGEKETAPKYKKKITK